MSGVGTPIEAGIQTSTTVAPEANTAPAVTPATEGAGDSPVTPVAAETETVTADAVGVSEEPEVEAENTSLPNGASNEEAADPVYLQHSEAVDKHLAETRAALDEVLGGGSPTPKVTKSETSGEDEESGKPAETNQELLSEFAKMRKSQRDENPDVANADSHMPDPKSLGMPTLYESLKAEFVKEGKDLKNKDVQRDLLDTYYYKQAELTLNAKDGKLPPEVRGNTEFMQIRDDVRKAIEAAGVDANTREIDKWALAMYLEAADKAKGKKKRNNLLITFLKGAVAATFGSAQSAARQSQPNLSGKQN
jgi:hypothetical protein